MMGTEHEAVEENELVMAAMDILVHAGDAREMAKKALEAVPGVSGVTMSLEEKTATVEMTGEVTDQELTGAVKEAGYEVTGIAVK